MTQWVHALLKLCQEAQGSVLRSSRQADASVMKYAERYFWVADKDGSHSLQQSELVTLLDRMGIKCSAADLRDVFREFDINGDSEFYN